MKRQWRLFASAFTLVLFAGFAVMPSSPATAEDDENGSVVGSWIGTLTFTKPSGINGLRVAILTNFNRDGTLTGNDGTAHSSQLELPPELSPLAVDYSDYSGSWVPIGDSNQIALTFKQLLFLGPQSPPDLAVTAIYCPGSTCGPAPTFPFPGQNIDLGTVQAVDVLEHTKSGDRITGDFTFQNRRLPPPLGDGQQVFAGRGIVSLTRIAIEKLAP